MHAQHMSTPRYLCLGDDRSITTPLFLVQTLVTCSSKGRLLWSFKPNTCNTSDPTAACPNRKAPENRLNLRLAHVVSLPERCSVIMAALLAPLSIFFHLKPHGLFNSFHLSLGQRFNSLHALKELMIAHILKLVWLLARSINGREGRGKCPFNMGSPWRKGKYNASLINCGVRSDREGGCH